MSRGAARSPTGLLLIGLLGWSPLLPGFVTDARATERASDPGAVVDPPPPAPPVPPDQPAPRRRSTAKHPHARRPPPHPAAEIAPPNPTPPPDPAPQPQSAGESKLDKSDFAPNRCPDSK